MLTATIQVQMPSTKSMKVCEKVREGGRERERVMKGAINLPYCRNCSFDTTATKPTATSLLDNLNLDQSVIAMVCLFNHLLIEFVLIHIEPIDSYVPFLLFPQCIV